MTHLDKQLIALVQETERHLNKHRFGVKAVKFRIKLKFFRELMKLLEKPLAMHPAQKIIAFDKIAATHLEQLRETIEIALNDNPFEDNCSGELEIIREAILGPKAFQAISKIRRFIERISICGCFSRSQR